jgi:Pyocin activator protein PrtN
LPNEHSSFILAAQYDGLAVIPVKTICRDYFSHLTPTNFLEKVRTGKRPPVSPGFGRSRVSAEPELSTGLATMLASGSVGWGGKRLRLSEHKFVA